MAEAAEGAGFRAGRGLSRPAARADLYPGQPDGPCRGARRRRHLRARRARAGRCASRPSSSAAGRIGGTAPSSRRTPPTCPRTRCCRASSSNSTRTCRRRGGSCSTATCPSARCSRRRCASGPSARSRSSGRSAATARKLIEQAQAQCRGSARPADGRDHAPRPRSCASWPTRSSCPTCPSGSRSMTTATSWAPTRPAR